MEGERKEEEGRRRRGKKLGSEGGEKQKRHQFEGMVADFKNLTLLYDPKHAVWIF